MFLRQCNLAMFKTFCGAPTQDWYGYLSRAVVWEVLCNNLIGPYHFLGTDIRLCPPDCFLLRGVHGQQRAESESYTIHNVVSQNFQPRHGSNKQPGYEAKAWAEG